MILDKPIVQPGGGRSSNPEYLRELIEWADEDKVCPVSRAEQLLEERRFERVMRMTPRAFAQLSPVERRNFTRWAKHLAKVFAEKAALFERNSTPEPTVPGFLQAQG